jgi:hypothetical protein
MPDMTQIEAARKGIVTQQMIEVGECGSLCSVNIDNAAIKFAVRRALGEAEAHAIH